jgi:2-polyprenyl-3-methyl-5-hydroxy-6-metoxy-1,4-benzoquinol methylase
MHSHLSQKIIQKCRVCNSMVLTPLYDSAKLGVCVYRCGSCRSKIVANDFSKSQLQAAYESAEDYYTLEGSDHESILRKKAKEISRQFEATSSGKKLLDIGAGTGIFLNAAREEGFDIYGTEFADLPIRIASEKYGIVLAKKTLEEDLSTYDVVTALSVLEHVERPYDLVKEAARILRPGGILAIYVPIYGSIDRVAWWLYILSGKRLTNLLDWRNSQAHLSMLTEGALRWLLKEHGLEIVSTHKLSEYNLPFQIYFQNVGIRSGLLLRVCVASMNWLVKNNLFFNNNIMVYARKPDNG